MKNFCLFSQSSLRNKKIIESWWSIRLLQKVITYILEIIITLKSMVQGQNYSIWYLESGAGNLINNEAYFEQKIYCKS